MSSKRRILIGITGGIAAYKIPLLVRLLKKNETEVKVVRTENAAGLVGDDALRTVSGSPVYCDASSFFDMNHIRLAQWAEWFLISPATANTIAKIAHGIADNLLCTLALSIPQERLIIAPAMNSVMWENTITQENISVLEKRGVRVLPVEEGQLACEVLGPGRMLSIEAIADYIFTIDEVKPVLKNKKVVIASGPTEEPIDPVRVITNRSSGKMGAALASTAISMGAQVTVVSGPASEPLPPGVRIVPVRTALEMQTALETEFADAHICIMAAAVSDYRPLAYSETKLHREMDGKRVIELVANPDISAELGRKKKKQLLVGFSLETNDDIKRAVSKMHAKKCDMMVFNRADRALGLDSTSVTILYPDGTEKQLQTMPKREAAGWIMRCIAEKSGTYYG